PLEQEEGTQNEQERQVLRQVEVREHREVGNDRGEERRQHGGTLSGDAPHPGVHQREKRRTERRLHDEPPRVTGQPEPVQAGEKQGVERNERGGRLSRSQAELTALRERPAQREIDEGAVGPEPLRGAPGGDPQDQGQRQEPHEERQGEDRRDPPAGNGSPDPGDVSHTRTPLSRPRSIVSPPLAREASTRWGPMKPGPPGTGTLGIVRHSLRILPGSDVMWRVALRVSRTQAALRTMKS